MNLLKALLVVVFLGLFNPVGYAAPVNVNTAGAAALADELNGVGPKIAAAIIEYRTQHGPFKKQDDLLNVKGIGPKILEKNRDNIVLGGPAKKAAK